MPSLFYSFVHDEVLTLRTLLLLLATLPTPFLRVQAHPPALVKGADIGWVMEMEAAGRRFYNRAGAEQGLFQPLREDYELNDYELNTIRLRV